MLRPALACSLLSLTIGCNTNSSGNVEPARDAGARDGGGNLADASPSPSASSAVKDASGAMPSSDGAAVPATDAANGSDAGEGGAAMGSDGGTDGSASDAGNAGDGLLRILPLQGPVTVDPAPVLLGSEQVVPALATTRVEQLALCDDGSILAYGNGALSRIGPDQTLAWQHTVQLDYLPNTTLSAVGAVTLTADCETLIGGVTNAGLPDFEYVGGGDAFVIRVDASGEVAWTHQWGSTSTEKVTGLAVLSDGSFFAMGSCDGQVPGSPVASRGFPFVEVFEADGTSVSLTQVARHPDGVLTTPSLLQAAGPSTFYQTGTGGLQAGAAVATFGEDGVQRTFAAVEGKRLRSDDVLGQWTETVALGVFVETGYHPDFGYFGLSPTFIAPTVADAPRSGLARFDAQGNISWLRLAETAEAVLDPVEGQTWTGDFYTFQRLLVTEDALYIVGEYSNTYANGSVVPQATVPAFIARYDLDGERVWFTQMLLDQSPLSDVPTKPLGYGALFVNAAGNLALYLRGLAPTEISGATYSREATYLVELDPGSGELL